MSPSLQLITKEYTAGVDASEPLVFTRAARRHIFIVNTGASELHFASSSESAPAAGDYYPIPVGGHREIRCGNASRLSFHGGGTFVFESDIHATEKQLAKYLAIDADHVAFGGLIPASAFEASLDDITISFTCAGWYLGDGMVQLIGESDNRRIALISDANGARIHVKNTTNPASPVDVSIALFGERYGDFQGVTNSPGIKTVTVHISYRNGNQVYADVVINGIGLSGQASIPTNLAGVGDTLSTIQVNRVFGTSTATTGTYSGKFLSFKVEDSTGVILDCPMVEANGVTQLSDIGPDLTVPDVWLQVSDWK